MPILRTLRRNPCATLLGVQLLGLLLYPLMEHTPTGRALFAGFGLVVLVMALRIVRRSPWATSVGVVLALALVVLSIANASGRVPEMLAGVTSALEAAFYFYAAGSLIAYMSNDMEASVDELFAAGATFTLLAWGFAHLFGLCQVVSPGSFGTTTAVANEARTWIELLFLSFTVLSSVGLGDIIPVTPMARGLVMIEEFTGVMYIALVVSRLVGLTIAGKR